MLKKIIVSFDASLTRLCVVTLTRTIYKINLLIKSSNARIINKIYFINEVIENEVLML